jgi:HlyD family secretion protein
MQPTARETSVPMSLSIGPGKPAKKRRQMLTILTGTVLLLTVSVAGWMWWSSQNGVAKDWKKNTAAVTRQDVDVRVTATGIIRPFNEVKISPKQTGLLKQLYVKQGDFVKSGQIIALMDDSNLRGQVAAAQGAFEAARQSYLKSMHGNRPQEVAVARLQEQRARAGISSAERNLIRLRATITSAESQFMRDKTLAERQTMLANQGAVSDQDRINALTQMQISRSNMDAAKQELQQAEAALDQSKADFSVTTQQRTLSVMGNRPEDIAAAKAAMQQAEGNLSYLQSQLNDMQIRAPFSGLITQKYADMGAIVTPTTSAATTSATSSSIVSLASNLEMVASVAETDIGKIKTGQDVEIRATAYPDKAFHGRVTQIAPAAVVTQNVTTFEVHSSIDDDRRGQLLAGMNVSTSFLAGNLKDALLVPTVSIVSRRGHTGVLVPEADGKPKFKRVKTGPTVGNNTVVTDGLSEGDLVFLGLSADQLKAQGYSSGGGWGGGGRGGMSGGMGGGGRGGSSGPPIPRSFGH